jgi:hypothetical protein
MRHCWVSPLTSGRPLSRKSLSGFGPIRHDCEQPRGHPPNGSILPLPRHLDTEGWRLKRSHHASVVEESLQLSANSRQPEEEARRRSCQPTAVSQRKKPGEVAVSRQPEEEADSEERSKSRRSSPGAVRFLLIADSCPTPTILRRPWQLTLRRRRPRSPLVLRPSRG